MKIVYTEHLDADMIYPGLWQGSLPPDGHVLAEAGFDVLVLCAREYQLEAELFPGVQVLHAPNDDDSSRAMTPSEWRLAQATGRIVANLVRSNKMVLVTCIAGINRSGLVSALAIHHLTGKSGRDCIRDVQRNRRGGALGNAQFREALRRLKEKKP